MASVQMRSQTNRECGRGAMRRVGSPEWPLEPRRLKTRGKCFCLKSQNNTDARTQHIAVGMPCSGSCQTCAVCQVLAFVATAHVAASFETICCPPGPSAPAQPSPSLLCCGGACAGVAGVSTEAPSPSGDDATSGVAAGASSACAPASGPRRVGSALSVQGEVGVAAAHAAAAAAASAALARSGYGGAGVLACCAAGSCLPGACAPAAAAKRDGCELRSASRGPAASRRRGGGGGGAATRCGRGSTASLGIDAGDVDGVGALDSVSSAALASDACGARRAVEVRNPDAGDAVARGCSSALSAALSALPTARLRFLAQSGPCSACAACSHFCAFGAHPPAAFSAAMVLEDRRRALVKDRSSQRRALQKRSAPGRD